MANKHMKRYSEMQIKNTMRTLPTPVKMSIIKSLQIANIRENMEKKEHLQTFSGNVNWYRHYGKQYGIA